MSCFEDSKAVLSFDSSESDLSAPWLRTRSSPGCSNPLMPDSIAGCARPAAAKDSSFSAPWAAFQRYPFPQQRLDVEQCIEAHPIVRAVKAAVETAGPQRRIQCLRFPHHRHSHVHVLALPQDLVVKDELILILDAGDGNPEFKRRARLALGNPARVFLENRTDLLLVRNRLATQKTPLHLVNLPPGVTDEAGDRAAAQVLHALVPQGVEGR